MNVQIKKIFRNAKTPTRCSEHAVGYDLYAYLADNEHEGAQDNIMTFIKPGETKIIPTGIKLGIPWEWAGLIFARSGLATKSGLRPANCVGVIDPDYRGEIKVALHNDSGEPQAIHHGDRIAQLVLTMCPAVHFEEVDKLSDTERGGGGFGSTGRQ